MTSKEFVKNRFPNAYVERFVSGQIKGLQSVYYLCFSQRSAKGSIRLSQGTSESNAWVKAKSNIEAYDLKP